MTFFRLDRGDLWIRKVRFMWELNRITFVRRRGENEFYLKIWQIGKWFMKDGIIGWYVRLYNSFLFFCKESRRGNPLETSRRENEGFDSLRVSSVLHGPTFFLVRKRSLSPFWLTRLGPVSGVSGSLCSRRGEWGFWGTVPSTVRRLCVPTSTSVSQRPWGVLRDVTFVLFFIFF